MSETGWSLDPQLRADTVAVCDLALSRVLAMNDANFPWLIVVPRRAGVSEIFDLGAEQAILLDEVSLVSRALKEATLCEKLNVAAIGNVVPQLHVHIGTGMIELIISATIGAILLLVILRLVNRRGRW